VRVAALRLGLNEEQADALVSLPNRNFIVQTPEGGDASQLEMPSIEKKESNSSFYPGL